MNLNQFRLNCRELQNGRRICTLNLNNLRRNWTNWEGNGKRRLIPSTNSRMILRATQRARIEEIRITQVEFGIRMKIFWSVVEIMNKIYTSLSITLMSIKLSCILRYLREWTSKSIRFNRTINPFQEVKNRPQWSQTKLL